MSRPWPTGLSAADLADYRQAQAEHEDLMQQVADREFQIEAGLIKSYADYRFAWQSEDLEPPRPPTAAPDEEAGHGAWDGFDGEDCPPF
ncbi:hypothetical protein ACFWJT_29980 [Streptomyces sp. NPDC127069]|uniref:hypothetical protein n=1 Tax=Streptomyces sp. NPDC127069 TaxID=3347128 RepID=UPI003650D044